MAADVLLLPGAPMAIHSFSERSQEPYKDAAAELRVAVVEAFVAKAEQAPCFERAATTIVCYSGTPARDRRYRPQRVTSLHYILEPIYEGLIQYGLLPSLEAVYSERLVLVRHALIEGWRIVVSELPSTRTARSLT